jgi:hypothetical protein
VRARLVVLAGGTVGSAQLLLRSRRWLPRLSPAVGRHIAFNGGIKLPGLLPADCPDGDMYTGRSHPGVVSYEFLGSHGIMLTAGKALPLQVAAGARLSFPGEPNSASSAPGVEMMRLFRKQDPRRLRPDAARGRLRLDHDGRRRSISIPPRAGTGGIPPANARAAPRRSQAVGVPATAGRNARHPRRARSRIHFSARTTSAAG